MKAVRFHQPGGPDVLVYEEIPTPEVSSDEVLIRVRACSLNRIDIWARSGLYKVDLPHTLGSEFAGDVASVGSEVSGISVGDRVTIFPAISDGTCPYCLKGDESLCDNFRIIGIATDGGYAEYAKVPAKNVFRIPDKIDYKDAAAVPLVFVTAWHMLITRANLKVGEKVLVQAAGSGIGSAAVQIAKLAGAEVVATAGSNQKLAKASELGADHLINYSETSFKDWVMSITEGRGVDVVFEHVGQKTFRSSLESLTKGGRLVIAGATTGAEASLDIRHLYSRQLTVIGSMLGTRSELIQVLSLVGDGKLRPVIDRTLPLEDAAKAHQMLTERTQFGKIVLIV